MSVDWEALGTRMFDATKGYVDRRVDPLLARISALESRMQERGQDELRAENAELRQRIASLESKAKDGLIP